MAFTKLLYTPSQQVPSSNLNDIQDELVAANGADWQPTMVGVANGDISVRKGWYHRAGQLAYVSAQLTWNNTNGGTAGDDVEINLPYRAADFSVFSSGPVQSFGHANPVFSSWATKATDRSLLAFVSHFAGYVTMRVQRISTTNTSPGNLTNDTGVARQLLVQISYPTDGTLLV